jgi:hypothetical protein
MGNLYTRGDKIARKIIGGLKISGYFLRVMLYRRINSGKLGCMTGYQINAKTGREAYDTAND